MWAFCYAKHKNAPYAKSAPEGAGSVWTWIALDQDSKLALSWAQGNRGWEMAVDFMADLQSRLAGRIQLSTDGYNAYPDAVERAFGADVDYARLVKTFAPAFKGEDLEEEHRYSPPPVVDAWKIRVMGNPKEEDITTAHVERHNLTLRMSVRRFTRLTNAFSKRLLYHYYGTALYFFWYNFCRPHKSLGPVVRTPAMAAGLTRHPLSMADLLEMCSN